MTITRELAHFIVESGGSTDALYESKRCMINLLAISIYASKDPSLDILLDVFHADRGAKHATVWGTNIRTTTQNAALANGYLGHLEDYDDTHFPSIIHPSAPTLPASLAIGELLGSSGKEVLLASTLGIELCCRIAVATHPYHYDAGWHITGTAGVFGSVAAAGNLLNLDVDQMTHALGIAGTQASGVREVFGSMTKPFHPGRAAQSGVLAAQLAKRGFTSTPSIMEGRRGFFAVLSAKHDLSIAIADLGERWEISMNEVKPYACGVVNHPLIDAMLMLRSRKEVSPSTVDRIDAKVHPLVLELVDRENPRSGLEGKFSYQHSLAVGLIDGSAFPAQFTDERVADPEVKAVRDRVSAIVNTSLDEDAAEVSVTLKDGSVHKEFIQHALGSPENPVTDAQLEEKFDTLVADVLPKRSTKRLLEMLWNLEDVADIREIMALVRTRRKSRA